MDKQDILTMDELIQILDSDSDNKFRKAADKLLEAFTDWPTQNIDNPADMISELRFEIKSSLTKINLDNYLRTLSPASDAWKMESISGLLNIFELISDSNNSEIDLTDVLDCLTKHYRQ